MWIPTPPTFCCHPVASMPILMSSFFFLSLIFAVGWQENCNLRSLTSPIKRKKGLLSLMATEINNSSRVFVCLDFSGLFMNFCDAFGVVCAVKSSQMLVSQILRMMFTFKWCRKAKQTKSGGRIILSRYFSRTIVRSFDDRDGAFLETYVRRHSNCLCTRHYPLAPSQKMIKHHQLMKFVSSRIFFRLTAVKKFTFHAIKTSNGGKKKLKGS